MSRPLPRPHPAKAVLVSTRTTQTHLAEVLGCSAKWVYMVLNNYVPAPATFKTATSQLLGLPESDLFHDDEITEPADAARAVVAALESAGRGAS